MGDLILAKRNNFTNYDSFSSIKDSISDDKIRFPFIGSCILTGSFDSAKKNEFNAVSVAHDRYILDVAEGIFERTDSIYSLVKSGSLDGISDQVLKFTQKNLSDLDERSKLISRSGYSDPVEVYNLSLKFKFNLIDYFDKALKDLGQRCEQRVINAYNNNMHNLIKDPSKRSPDNYKRCLRTEHYFILNSLEDVYEQYMG